MVNTHLNIEMHINCRQYFPHIIYLLAFIGILSVFHYAHYDQKKSAIISTSEPKYQPLMKVFDDFKHSNSNLLLQYIRQCPECMLFSFKTENSSDYEALFHILNRIPINSQAIFYPLTMRLYYNQPIPFYTILSHNQTEVIMRTRNYWINQIQKINDIQINSILDFILQSLKKSIELARYSWPNRTKLILYYTRFFGNPYWYNSNAKQVYSNDFHPNNCPLPTNACLVTTNHSLFSESDALLIHLREAINYDKLNNLTRHPRQRYVFFLKESPVHSPTLSTKQHGHLFNYTQTYRPDSDITATTLQDLFWLFDYKIHPTYDYDSIVKSKIPGKVLVAIISNCGGSSNRLKYIKELKNYTSVDIFGKCGSQCPNNNQNCRQNIYSNYKFYLAFENSMCDEYVTEKFFYSLNSARIVPVVLGWARYYQYVPSSAYIDVRNFSTAHELAEYINYLDKNETAYLEYFKWRQYALYIKLPKYMCELCLKLFLDDKNNQQQSLTNIDQYWNRKTQCHTFQQNQAGKWIAN